MKRDDAYLLDMLLAARRARRFCEGVIDLPTVWQTVRDEIAPLVAQLEPLV